MIWKMPCQVKEQHNAIIVEQMLKRVTALGIRKCISFVDLEKVFDKAPGKVMRWSFKRSDG